MSTQGSVQIVKELFAAMGCGDLQGVLALTAEDVEWVIPGVGLSTGKIKAANKAFKDHFVFTMTVRDGKVTHIRSISTRWHWRGSPG